MVIIVKFLKIFSYSNYNITKSQNDDDYGKNRPISGDRLAKNDKANKQRITTRHCGILNK